MKAKALCIASALVGTVGLSAMQAWAGVTGPVRDKSSATGATSAMNRARAGSPQHSSVQHVQPRVYGKTYGEWAIDWAQWSQAGPAGQNAMTDPDGRYCDQNQPNRNIWFLAGTLQGTGPAIVNRACTIPKGRALFYPLVTSGWIDCPDSSDLTVSDADVQAIVAGNTDAACQLTSTLDGIAISSRHVLTVRAQSRKFTSFLPSNPEQIAVCSPPLVGGKTGRQFVEGYWVMLPPLSPGKHKLTLHGAVCSPNGPASFETGVTYDLTVRSW
jgi:hypothetical protein